MKKIMVALAGQPNAGKSTIFNMLTGARQHVANYPGVTVEKRTGEYSYGGHSVFLTDLPGTYSLTSYSREEKIARDFLLHERPDVVLNIVDAANLERNLYLTFQLEEMGLPIVMALNMVDVARDHGLSIDAVRLSELLGAPVIPAVGKQGTGGNEIKEAILQIFQRGDSPYECETFDGAGAAQDPIPFMNNKPRFRVDYGKELESHLKPLEGMILQNSRLHPRYPSRWLAVKLIENDSEARRLVMNEQEKEHEVGSTLNAR